MSLVLEYDNPLALVKSIRKNLLVMSKNKNALYLLERQGDQPLQRANTNPLINLCDRQQLSIDQSRFNQFTELSVVVLELSN